MTTVPNTPRYPRPPLADWSATDAIVEANRRGIRVSQLLAEDWVAEAEAAKRATVGEVAVNFALVLLGLVVAYLVCVGAIATTISQGWSA